MNENHDVQNEDESLVDVRISTVAKNVAVEEGVNYSPKSVGLGWENVRDVEEMKEKVQENAKAC